MRYVDEFREPRLIQRWSAAIAKKSKQSFTLMEICGGQTHNIIKFGLDSLLPETIRLVHGPGCPVCVTPVAMIDAAITAAKTPNTILCSFGDMLRVPGSESSLLEARAHGADVRVVLSPRDAVQLAARENQRNVVFFAVGFETTAPANAAAVVEARQLKLDNFSIMVSHVLVPPAIEAVLSPPDRIIQGFLAAGHVCTITGYESYHAIAKKYRVPLVVTGFEPLDILQGIYLCVEQLESGRYEVENQYGRSVRPDGNLAARALLDEIFEICDREWRGIGMIPQSGYRLRPQLAKFDAFPRYSIIDTVGREAPECKAGEILQGKIKPTDCTAFGRKCRPESPLGAPMVSNEGACAAYYLYRMKGATHA